MTSPFLAFTLSFFLPGAGLWYLGRKGWAVINLVVVVAMGCIAAILLSEESFDKYIHYVAIGCAGGSGGVAMSLSQQRNQKRLLRDDPHVADETDS